MDDVEVAKIVGKLTPLDKEWLTGWLGPPGAAYNVIGEDLQEMGLLDGNWNRTVLGERVAQHLKQENAK